MKSAEIISFNKVACRDPFDLRPAVIAIMRRIRHAVSVSDPGQPVVVLMGENHRSPVDMLLQQAVLARLKKYTADNNLRFAIGIERPYDELNNILRRVGNLPDDFRVAVSDPDGRRMLKGLMADMQDETPLAQANLYAFCHHQHFNVRFNDLPDIDDMLIPDDPRTLRLMQETLGSDTPIDLFSREGYYLRNLAMTQMGFEHMADTSVKIYVQLTGVHHVLGNEAEGDEVVYNPYAESLHALFAAGGARVIPVINHLNYKLPAMPKSAHDGCVFISGLPACQFYNPDDPNGHERTLIRRIAAESGNEIRFYDHALNRRPWRSIVEKLAPQWAVPSQMP